MLERTTFGADDAHVGMDDFAATSAGSDREAQRHDAVLGALTHERYQCCLYLGHANAELTQVLAQRCDAVDAVGSDEGATARTRTRDDDAQACFLPAHWPPGDATRSYDLIVLSDVLHHFTIPALVRLAARVAEVASPGAEFVVTHGHDDSNHPLTCARATELFQLLVRAERKTQLLHAAYRLETWLAPGLECEATAEE